MRRVASEADLLTAVARSRSESEKAFGHGTLLLERALDGARHIEVQIVGDALGHVFALGERDCSAQRRFQKVVEEGPSPFVDEALRARLFETAVRVGEQAKYVGVGTVEFLVDAASQHYFLEMNTRIQVEHPVTELVTGLDLVELQLMAAQGEDLSARVRVPPVRDGHAIEARLCAEDPAQGFLPQTGRVLGVHFPDVRVDHAVRAGMEIGSHYDSLLAKIIVHGSSREDARRRLCQALRNTQLLGLRTNREFLISLLEHPAFLAGQVTTDFVERELSTGSTALDTAQHRASPRALALAAVLVVQRVVQREVGEACSYAPELSAFSNRVPLSWPIVLNDGVQRHSLQVCPGERAGQLRVVVDDQSVCVRVQDATSATLADERVPYASAWEATRDAPTLWLSAFGRTHCFHDVTRERADAQRAAGTGQAVAPLDGAVVEVLVAPGEPVVRGQALIVIEAMKLQLRVASDVEGVVANVHVGKGAQVRARQLLVEIAPPAAASSPSAHEQPST